MFRVLLAAIYFEAGRLRGWIAFLFRGEWLIDEYAENTLADFTLMQMFALAFVELSVACSGFEETPVFDMANETLHA